jgi:hypothetical protein
MVPCLIYLVISTGINSLMAFMKLDSQYPPSEALSAALLFNLSATGFEDTIFFM